MAFPAAREGFHGPAEDIVLVAGDHAGDRRAWDIYAIVFVGGNSTVSFEFYRLGKRFPTFYLIVGLLIGHIVFPLHVHDDKPPLGGTGP